MRYGVEARDQGNQTYLTVTVETLDQLDEIFNAVRNEYSEDDRGYLVQFVCSTGGTKGAANAVGNGAYAHGPMGAAATGLDDSEHQLEVRADAECPAQ